jgi:hypothetical protein
MPGTPISLKIYGTDNEVLKEITRPIIPWGILKKAAALAKNLDLENIDETDIDGITGLVIEIFDGQVTLSELDKGADVGDMISIIRGIVSRAGALVKENPTQPPPKSK